MDMQLQGRTALVCGGSGDIGLACAVALAEEGVSVVIAARNEDRIRNAIRKLPGVARGVSVDLAAPDAVAKLKQVAADADIIVTNPGVSPGADILTAGDEWSGAIQKIVARPVAIVEAYLPSMRERGFGRIINITSSAALIANPALAFSGALRAALTHTMSNLARRVAADGVTVNNIAPGPVESTSLRELFERLACERNLTVEDIRAERLRDTPTGRFATPAEIGRMAVYLASPHAANITGRTMLLDGGANPYPFL